jgi:tripartite ATP-independent transporter DctM subunit
MALIFRDTASITAQIMLIIGASALFSWILAREQVPQNVAQALLGELPPMGAAFLILGGILGGWFTPTEAAGIGALYMLVLAFAYGTVRLPQLALIFKDTALITAQIMLIIGASALLSWILAREQVPQTVATALLGFTDNPLVFLLIINLLLIFLGMILEPTSALLIVTPILLPVAVEFGIDPLQFGSIIIFDLMIGMITPPMGGVVFVLSSVTRIPVERVFKGAAYYLPALFVVLLLITYVPAITLWLPTVVGLR